MDEIQVPKVVTLANMAECSDQEVFDHISYRMAKQGFERCVDQAEKCVYYDSASGRTCAAGACVGSDEYTSSLEGASWGSLLQEGLVPSKHYVLMRYAQIAHDCGKTPEKMFNALIRLARRFNLDDANLRAYAAGVPHTA